MRGLALRSYTTLILGWHFSVGAPSTLGFSKFICVWCNHTKFSRLNNKKALKLSAYFGADERTWTPMVSRQILSLVRLPISPHPHVVTYPRFERGTPWLKVMCSTNWANRPYSIFNGWGSRIWTYECESQSLVPYRLATPQYIMLNIL